MTHALDRLLVEPWSPRDPEAVALNLSLRMGPNDGRLVLIAERDGRFALARLVGTRPGKVERLGPTFASALEGEREVLRRRFEARS